MTPDLQARPRTALELLYGPGDGAAGQLAGQIQAAGADGDLGHALRGLPGAAGKAAAGEVASQAASLLDDVNLVDVLIAGWREHRDLTAAARRTLAAAGSTELVELVTHRITESLEPYVSVLVDGHPVATLRLGLSLDFEIRAVLAGVSGGRLTALHAGDCDVTAGLALQDIEVASRRARFDLPGVIPLGSGVRLLPAAEYPAGP